MQNSISPDVQKDASNFYLSIGDRGLYPFSTSVDVMIKTWEELVKSKDKQELESKEWKSIEASYIKHLEWRFNYPAVVYKNQMISSWIILSLIVILVLGGVSFSLIQLLWALKLGDVSTLSTDLSIQTAGELSFKSTIIGAFVLILSLLFFYLYLRHVFKSKEPIPPHVSLSETDAQKIFKSN